jgi:hypothetical protein
MCKLTTPNNIRYCTAIAGSWDGGMDRYVIAWLTDNVLSLKLRHIHVTNYKTMPIKTSSDNTNYIYPNPAQQVIHFKSSAQQSSPYTILNYQGITVSKGNTSTTHDTEIRVSHLSNGMYFLQHEGQTLSFTIKR